jgi:hypothetical protein
MLFDLGLTGVGLLVVLSMAFGMVAQFFARARTPWMWMIAAIGWFIGGLVASEVVWGAMTVDEIQPIVDGLAFVESLLGGLVVGVPVAIVAWFAAGGHSTDRPIGV